MIFQLAAFAPFLLSLTGNSLSNASVIKRDVAPASTIPDGWTYSNIAPRQSTGVNATAILPFKYRGCYTDNSTGGRALQYQFPDDTTLTIESCVQECSAKGYTIAGMEYGKQCFCDTYLRNSATLVGDSDCSMSCAGDDSEDCGAGNRLSVYINGRLKKASPVTVQKTGLPGNWQYQGCLTDSAQNRALMYMTYWPTNNTNVHCLNLCAQYGYGAGGTEFGEQCFCGDASTVIASGATIQPDTDCNIVCPGTNKATSYYCGGGNRISYYTWTGNLNTWNYAQGNAAGQYQFLIGGPVIPLVTTPARNGKVTYMEKFGTEPANNSTGAYELDLSLLSNYNAAWRTMHVKSDIFCSASLTLPDSVGRQINIGGWSDPSTHGIRLYWPDGKPGVPGVNDWQENGAEVALLEGRWYPTAMTMANGSILVMGGEAGSNGAPVPSLEVLPSPSGKVLYAHYLDRTDPFNLYPYMVVLPSGGIFVAYYNEARILDPVTLQTKKVLPNIPGAVNNFLAGRSYPFEGTAMVMPQYASNYNTLTVLICGGSTPGPEVALDNCVSINPDDAKPKWTIERMPSQRVIPCMTALPDGTYLIANGAQQGVAGFGLATNPNLNSVLYNPKKPLNARMTVMANTTIARLYHSEAVLLDDGRVLISGSDPEDTRYPQEYRNEVWIPPYLMGGAKRPSMKLTNLDWKYGQQIQFSITPSGTGSVSGYKISMIGAVASTHGNSMGQRTFFPATSCSGKICTVTAPPNANVCPPSWFQVFLVDGNGIPSSATWVRVGGDPASLGNWPKFPDFSTPGVGAVKPIL